MNCSSFKLNVLNRNELGEMELFGARYLLDPAFYLLTTATAAPSRYYYILFAGTTPQEARTYPWICVIN
jgi:hypothetical protein